MNRNIVFRGIPVLVHAAQPRGRPSFLHVDRDRHRDARARRAADGAVEHPVDRLHAEPGVLAPGARARRVERRRDGARFVLRSDRGLARAPPGAAHRRTRGGYAVAPLPVRVPARRRGPADRGVRDHRRRSRGAGALDVAARDGRVGPDRCPRRRPEGDHAGSAGPGPDLRVRGRALGHDPVRTRTLLLVARHRRGRLAAARTRGLEAAASGDDRLRRPGGSRRAARGLIWFGRG